VFLFDEPLSNLDAELRVEMRVEIARLHREIGATMIYVTHDQVEAMTLADKIVVLRKGVIEQVGKPLELYHNPDNRFVAGFIGSPAMNFVSGTVEGRSVVTKGLVGDIKPDVGLPATGAGVVIGLRPQALRVVDGATHRVEITEALGGVSFIHLTAASGEKLIVEARGDVIAAPGTMVGVDFDAKDALFFTADAAGQRLR
jgi:lactose/L-arabinose transport system ATP-binding protein